MDVLISGVTKRFLSCSKPLGRLPNKTQESLAVKTIKPFYDFARGRNIKFLAPVVVSVIFTESKTCSFQVLPIGRAVPTPAVPLGCQTLPVSSVREEVRPQRPPVQTHQSAPLPADQPDGSRRKLSCRLGTSGKLCEPRNPSISRRQDLSHGSRT